MRVAIVDCETTGLLRHPRAKPALQPRVIEFGAIIINAAGERLDAMSQLFNPEQDLEAIITKITGLTDADLCEQPKFAQLAEDVSRFISGCDVIIAHNLPFDKGVLELEFQRLGIQCDWPKIQLCTVQENAPVYGYRVKLKDLYADVMGQPLAQTHRALDDCEALAHIVTTEGYLEGLT